MEKLKKKQQEKKKKQEEREKERKQSVIKTRKESDLQRLSLSSNSRSSTQIAKMNFELDSSYMSQGGSNPNMEPLVGKLYR